MVLKFDRVRSTSTISRILQGLTEVFIDFRAVRVRSSSTQFDRLRRRRVVQAPAELRSRYTRREPPLPRPSPTVWPWWEIDTPAPFENSFQNRHANQPDETQLRRHPQFLQVKLTMSICFLSYVYVICDFNFDILASVREYFCAP